MSCSLRYGSGSGSPCLWDGRVDELEKAMITTQHRSKDSPHRITNRHNVISLGFELRDASRVREDTLSHGELRGTRIQEHQGSRHGGRDELIRAP